MRTYINLEEVVLKFESELTSVMGVNCKMTKNVSDFGTSYYLYLNVNNKFVDDVKIRLSDHSVTSNRRILSEVHVSRDINEVSNSVEQIERMFFPERYNEVKVSTGTKRIEWSKSNMDNFTGSYEIVGERVTKKGSVQLILEIPTYKKVFVKK